MFAVNSISTNFDYCHFTGNKLAELITQEDQLINLIVLDRLLNPFSWDIKQWKSLSCHHHHLILGCVKQSHTSHNSLEKTEKAGETVKNWSALLLVSSNELEDYIHLLKIAVLPEYRRRGLALAMMGHLRNNFKEKRITLEVALSNRGAIEFYQREGFRILHQHKGYYSNGEDALIMEKTP